MPILSDHAKLRTAQRGVDPAWVEATIAAPDWPRRDRDPDLTQAFKANDAFAGRVLKIVYRGGGGDILVVTACFDRGARPP